MALHLTCYDDWQHHLRDCDDGYFPHNFICDSIHRRKHLKYDPCCHRVCLDNKVTVDEKNGFNVVIDIHPFKSDEISIKTVNETITLEGKLNRQDGRDSWPFFISREFIRKFRLPRGYNPATVVSTLSSDGILTISAPAPPKQDATERVVSIEPTGAYFTASSGKDGADNSQDEKIK